MIRRLSAAASILLGMLVPALAAPIDIGIAHVTSADEVRAAADAFVAEAKNRVPDQELRILPTLDLGEPVLKAVQNGDIGIAILPITVVGTGSASALVQPWQFADVEAVRRALASEVGAVVKSDFENAGVLTLGLWAVSFTHIGVRTELATLDDLKGKKIIAGAPAGQSARVIAEVGAAPTVIAAGETLPAVTAGAVDGAVIPADSRLQDSGIVSALRTVVDQPYQPVVVAVVVNPTVWRGLSYPAQVGLVAAARAADKRVQLEVAKQEQQFKTVLANNGVRLAAFNPADRAAAQQASRRAWQSTQADPQQDQLARAVVASRVIAGPQLASTVSFPAARQTVYFATDRVPENTSDPALMFGSKGEQDRLHFGRATVDLMAGRKLDSDLESYSGIRTLDRLELAEFQARLRESTTNPRTPVILFVHGYNNDFSAALRRAATIRQDIAPDAVVVAMSWPSDGTLLAYGYDESMIDVTNRNFRAFMAAIDGAVGRERVSIIAHSMGSRLVLNYFDWSSGRAEFSNMPKFAALIFAASDVAVPHFRQQKDRLVEVAKAVTLYVSEHDRALYLSEKVHLGPRIGRAPTATLFIESPLVTIDASDIDKPEFFVDFSLATRHSYVFDKVNGVSDLKELLSGSELVRRTLLTPKQRGNDAYWALRE